jgi:hypothetical protein
MSVTVERREHLLLIGLDRVDKRNSMPVGSVGYEAEGRREGQVHIWLEERWLNKLTALRQPGESYSILRVAAAT